VTSIFNIPQEHEAALRYFQRSTQLDPSFAYAYTLSGHEYFACEDFEQARKLYHTALSVDRRHYNAWCVTAALYLVPSLYTSSTLFTICVCVHAVRA